MATFDATPCFGGITQGHRRGFIKREYLPQVIDPEILTEDKRSIKEQLAAIHLYDLTHDCPTNAAIILFGTDPQYYMHGCYVQYVHFEGLDTGSEILNERRIKWWIVQNAPSVRELCA